MIYQMSICGDADKGNFQDELNIPGLPPAREAKTEVSETQGEFNLITFSVCDIWFNLFVHTALFINQVTNR